VLVVLSRTDAVAARALRNLVRASTVDAGELNAHDVLAHDWVLFTDETLPVAEHDRDDHDPAASEVPATDAETGDDAGDETEGAG
jgi:hypothetical protein